MQPQRIILIISVLLCIVLIIGGVFFLWPQYQSFTVSRAELKVVEEDIAQKEAYFNDLRSLGEKLEGYSEEVKKIDIALSQEPSVPILFYYFQKVVAENGLILSNISYQESAPNAKSGMPTFTFSLSVSGSYSALKGLLFALYSNSKLFEVDSIGLSSSSAQSQGTKEQSQPDYFNFNLTVSTSFSGQTQQTQNQE
jgi:Tfp pilus assembly protein PilO